MQPKMIIKRNIMKKLLSLFAVLFLACIGSAQTMEECKPFAFLENVEKLNVVFNYEEADFDGHSFAEFINLLKKDDYRTWDMVEKEWRVKFLREINDVLAKDSVKVFVNGEDYDYSFLVKLKIIDAKGTLACVCKVFDNQGEYIGVHKDYYMIRGGVVGDTVNLIGDGHERLGTELGRFVSQMRNRIRYYKQKGKM